ncbi:hypothetical protein ABBQ38_007942 [Trebouxia sp. C0009 RCD-2024]
MVRKRQPLGDGNGPNGVAEEEQCLPRWLDISPCSTSHWQSQSAAPDTAAMATRALPTNVWLSPDAQVDFTQQKARTQWAHGMACYCTCHAGLC